MKKGLIFTVMLVGVLVLGFSQSALSGTYRYDANYNISFTGNTFNGSWGSSTISGTYSVSGTRLTLNITGGTVGRNTWNWTIVDANTLRDQDGDSWRKEGGGSAQNSGSQTSNPYADTRWVFVDGNVSSTITMTNNGFTFVNITSGGTTNYTGTYTYSGNNIRFSNPDGVVRTATVIDNIMTLRMGANEYRYTKQTSSGSQTSNPYADTRWVFGHGYASMTVTMTNNGFTFVIISSPGETTNSTGTYTYSGNNIRFLFSDGVATATVIDNIMTLRLGPNELRLTKLVGDFLMNGTTLAKYCGIANNVTIPAGVTAIGDYALFGCSSLTSVTIPSSVTSIGEGAFGGCTSLTSITIPSSVTSIGSSAFFQCTSLTGITVDAQNRDFSSVDGVLFNKNRTELITYPAGKQGTSYTIPSSVTSIGEQAFGGCTSLTSVTIPSGVTSIGEQAFGGCTSLTGITIPSSVTSIGELAFVGCTSLTGITIPSSVTVIGTEAFRDCRSLRSVTISRRTTIGNNAFPSTAQITYSD